jgi:hypothetical protein
MPLKGSAKATPIESINKALAAKVVPVKPQPSISEFVVEGKNGRMKIPIKATHNNFSSIVHAKNSFKRILKSPNDVVRAQQLPPPRPKSPKTSRSANMVRVRPPSTKAILPPMPSKSLPKMIASDTGPNRQAAFRALPPPRSISSRPLKKPGTITDKGVSKSHNFIRSLLRTLRRATIRRLALVFPRIENVRRIHLLGGWEVISFRQPIFQYPEPLTSKAGVGSIPELDASYSGEVYSSYSKTFVKFASDSVSLPPIDRVELAEPFSQDKFREFFLESAQHNELDLRAKQFRTLKAKGWTN